MPSSIRPRASPKEVRPRLGRRSRGTPPRSRRRRGRRDARRRLGSPQRRAWRRARPACFRRAHRTPRTAAGRIDEVRILVHRALGAARRPELQHHVRKPSHLLPWENHRRGASSGPRTCVCVGSASARRERRAQHRARSGDDGLRRTVTGARGRRRCSTTVERVSRLLLGLIAGRDPLAQPRRATRAQHRRVRFASRRGPRGRDGRVHGRHRRRGAAGRPGAHARPRSRGSSVAADESSSAADLRSPAPYRLYRATVTAHFMLCPRSAGEPCAAWHGLRYDHRTPLHALYRTRGYTRSVLDPLSSLRSSWATMRIWMTEVMASPKNPRICNVWWIHPDRRRPCRRRPAARRAEQAEHADRGEDDAVDPSTDDCTVLTGVALEPHVQPPAAQLCGDPLDVAGQRAQRRQRADELLLELLLHRFLLALGERGQQLACTSWARLNDGSIVRSVPSSVSRARDRTRHRRRHVESVASMMSRIILIALGSKLSAAEALADSAIPMSASSARLSPVSSLPARVAGSRARARRGRSAGTRSPSPASPRG